MTSHSMYLALLASAFLLAASPVRTVAGEPILTLEADRDGNGTIETQTEDLAWLDSLPQTSFKTSTPWHEGVVEFSGVSLKDYLAATKASGKTIRLTALNDYMVEGDIATLIEGEALLATRTNGEPMSLEDKGPVFVIFPFDSRPELQHQTFYSRAVWQLAKIEVVQ